MADNENSQIEKRSFGEHMGEMFLIYAKDVIGSRALPDARDGMKPVHRRIIESMYDLKLHANGPFKKSAKTVGQCLGKYHPHGDTSVYEAMVNLAQDFNLKYPLVTGHGRIVF